MNTKIFWGLHGVLSGCAIFFLVAYPNRWLSWFTVGILVICLVLLINLDKQTDRYENNK